MKIKPLYNQVLVEPIEMDMRTKTGLIVTENSTRAVKMQKGRVVAVGGGLITPEGGLMPLTVKPDDIVLFIRGSGLDMRMYVDGSPLLMFKEADLFGIVERSVEELFKEVLASEVDVDSKTEAASPFKFEVIHESP